MRSTSSSAIDEWAMTRRNVVQRWPAVPAAANTMPRTARSRSADGATIAALFPPSSSSSATEASGDARRDRPAHPGGAGRAQQGDAGIVDERPPRSPPRLTTDDSAAGAPDPARCLGRQRLAGERGEQRLVGRLPHDGIAADEGERGVPRPHRDREVERADDTDRPRAGATAPSSGAQVARMRW